MSFNCSGRCERYLKIRCFLMLSQILYVLGGSYTQWLVEREGNELSPQNHDQERHMLGEEREQHSQEQGGLIN